MYSGNPSKEVMLNQERFETYTKDFIESSCGHQIA